MGNYVEDMAILDYHCDSPVDMERTSPSFFRGDIDINSTTFGRLTSVNVGSRVVQLSVRFEF